LYSNALSGAEILSYHDTTKPVTENSAQWHFDEGSGKIAYDAIGGNNGTIFGATWVDGISGSVLGLDGISAEVVLLHSDDLNITGDKISLTYWFELDEIGSDRCFIFKNTQYLSRINSHGKLDCSLYTPDWVSVDLEWVDRIHDTDWHFLANTYNGNDMKIYVDGQCMVSENASENIQSAQADLYLVSQNKINHFNGIIDEVGIFNYCLLHWRYMIYTML